MLTLCQGKPVERRENRKNIAIIRRANITSDSWESLYNIMSQPIAILLMYCHMSYACCQLSYILLRAIATHRNATSAHRATTITCLHVSRIGAQGPGIIPYANYYKYTVNWYALKTRATY